MNDLSLLISVVDVSTVILFTHRVSTRKSSGETADLAVLNVFGLLITVMTTVIARGNGLSSVKETSVVMI